MSIYLDNSATTQVRPEVREAMMPYLGDRFGNPSSIHSIGKQAASALKLAREQVAGLLNCEPDEIYFSSCGTVSNNAAILGRARFAEANQLGKHLLTSQIEHPSVFGPAQHLESKDSPWQVSFVPVDRAGIVQPKDVASRVKPESSIISIMWANNEIGTIQPIQEIAELAHEHSIFMHTDAVQIPGKLPIDMKKTPVSSLSLSGHKFYAPKGTGILFLRRKQNIMPIFFGGGQEMGLLPGTESIANIVGIGKAAELAKQELASNQCHLREMQEIFNRVLNRNLASGLNVSGPTEIESRLPGHLSFYLPGTEGEALVLRADLKGICISSGSACHKGIIEASQVMKALGIGNDDAKGSIRISIGRFNTKEECEKAANILADILTKAAKQLAVQR